MLWKSGVSVVTKYDPMESKMNVVNVACRSRSRTLSDICVICKMCIVSYLCVISANRRPFWERTRRDRRMLAATSVPSSLSASTPSLLLIGFAPLFELALFSSATSTDDVFPSLLPNCCRWAVVAFASVGFSSVSEAPWCVNALADVCRVRSAACSSSLADRHRWWFNTEAKTHTQTHSLLTSQLLFA